MLGNGQADQVPKGRVSENFQFTLKAVRIPDGSKEVGLMLEFHFEVSGVSQHEWVGNEDSGERGKNGARKSFNQQFPSLDT